MNNLFCGMCETSAISGMKQYNNGIFLFLCSDCLQKEDF